VEEDPSSSSSSSDDEKSSKSSSVGSSDEKETILRKPRKLSLAESVPIRTESASEIPDIFADANLTEVTQEAVEEQAEVSICTFHLLCVKREIRRKCSTSTIL